MEEDIPKNHIDTMLNAHETEELNSEELSDMYMITFTNIDDNNFKMIAENPEGQFIYEFKMSDYVNLKEKDFTSQINNFKLLLATIDKALEKNKVILTQSNDSLKLTFYYTNIYDEKKISFELKKELSEEEKEQAKESERQEREKQILMTKDSEQIEEEDKNKVDYKAEIIEYDKKFEDFGDRNIIKVLIENKGSHYWPKEKTSFRCSQEFSSLICKEYFVDENVKPGEQIELALEFLKNQKENLKQPYITSLNLYVHPQKFEPMLVLDFNENYTNENIPFEGPELKKEQKEEEKEEENDMIVINDVNIFDETKKEKKGGEKIEIKKGKTLIKKKIKTKVVETEAGPKEMTPFQRRIYELNQKEKERVQKEKERQQKTGWKKNF